MKMFTGAELMDSFSGLDRAMSSLKLMADDESIKRMAKEAGFDDSVEVGKLKRFALQVLSQPSACRGSKSSHESK